MYDNIINLFSSFEEFYNLPFINLSDIIYSYPKSALHDIFFFRQYIDYVKPCHLPYPIMRAKDIYDRPVICVKYYHRKLNRYIVESIFKRYCEITRKHIWTSGSDSGNTLILNSGNDGIMNQVSLNYLQRLLNKEKCGNILVDTTTRKYYEEKNEYNDDLGSIYIKKDNY